jgi:hypothetical protein
LVVCAIGWLPVVLPGLELTYDDTDPALAAHAVAVGLAVSWVADRRLPAVASGDFHRREHLATWKTLLPCAKEAGAVVEFLRSPRPASLVQLADTRPARRAA